MPKCDFRYSKSHLMPPKTFLECTGSVVGWYGLLAPEIMEVLEASPWNPSASSLFLMISLYAPTRTGTFSTVAQWIPHRLALKTKKTLYAIREREKIKTHFWCDDRTSYFVVANIFFYRVTMLIPRIFLVDQMLLPKRMWYKLRYSCAPV